MNQIQKVITALLSMQRHSWEQGCAMQAFYEMGRMDIVVPLAVEAVNRAMADGRPATIGVFNGVTDPCSVGQALHAAAECTADKSLINAEKALLHWALEAAPRNDCGVLYHLSPERQFWSDSLYMLPPYLVSAGYVDQALSNLFAWWDILLDKESGLLCHIWDEELNDYADAAHWGSGCGWALAGAARVLHLLGDGYHTQYVLLQNRAKTLLDRVLQFQRPDGGFHDILDDSESFVEWNLSQMVAYTIYCGMTDGWLDNTYFQTADFLRRSAEQHMDSYGFIRPVCGAPTFDRPGISPEAQAFFLLMQNSARLYKESLCN